MEDDCYKGRRDDENCQQVVFDFGSLFVSLIFFFFFFPKRSVAYKVVLALIVTNDVRIPIDETLCSNDQCAPSFA